MVATRPELEWTAQPTLTSRLMDCELDLDAERAAALDEWRLQEEELQGHLSRLQTLAPAVPIVFSIDDLTALDQDAERLWFEFVIVAGELSELLKLRKRLEKAFRKWLHQIEVNLSCWPVRRIHEAAKCTANCERAKKEAEKNAERLRVKYGLSRLPDLTPTRIERGLKRFYPS
jgi:hypothetical protein